MEAECGYCPSPRSTKHKHLCPACEIDLFSGMAFPNLVMSVVPRGSATSQVDNTPEPVASFGQGLANRVPSSAHHACASVDSSRCICCDEGQGQGKRQPKGAWSWRAPSSWATVSGARQGQGFFDCFSSCGQLPLEKGLVGAPDWR